MLQAMSTGHEGLLTTIHAKSAEDANELIEDPHLLCRNLISLDQARIPLASRRLSVARYLRYPA